MNLCIFSGRLTKDAKTQNTSNGKFVARYGLAVPVGWGDNKRTIFLNCVHWNCEKLSQFLRKGTAVTIRGQYDEREYEKDGETKRISEIVVAELEFQQRAKEEQAPAPQPAPAQPAPAQSNDYDYDPTIPF